MGGLPLELLLQGFALPQDLGLGEGWGSTGSSQVVVSAGGEVSPVAWYASGVRVLA